MGAELTEFYCVWIIRPLLLTSLDRRQKSLNTSVLERGQWSDSHLWPIYPRARAPVTHYSRSGSTGNKSGCFLDRKNLFLVPGMNPSSLASL